MIWLIPLSLLYRLVIGLRAFAYSKGIMRTRRLAVPVICVGNITMGGEGKTPIVMEVARRAAEDDRKPAIISRGYGRTIIDKEPLVVSDGEGHCVETREGGDEPVLIGTRLKNVPVVVAADRYTAGQCAIDEFGSDVMIMDDGFQHFQLARDGNFVVFDATRSISNLKLIPAGRLREPLSGLKRASALILTKVNLSEAADKIEQELKSIVGSMPILRSTFELECWLSLKDMNNILIDSDDVVVSVCAVGNAQAFHSFSEGMFPGGVVSKRSFSDHHRYVKEDFDEIEGKRKASNADWIVTTEKDAVKLRELDFDKSRWIVARMRARFDEDDSLELDRLIAESIVRKDARA